MDRLSHHLDDVLSACLYVLQTHKKVGAEEWHNPVDISGMLGNLATFDPVLKRAMMTSDKLVRYLIASWVANSEKGGRPFVSFDATTLDGERCCPISDLFSHCLADDDCRAMVFDLLLNHPEAAKLRMRIVAAAVSRCQTFAALSRNTVEDELKKGKNACMIRTRSCSTIEIVFGMLHQIIGVVSRLSLLPILSLELLRSGYAESMFLATSSWILKKTTRREKDCGACDFAVSVLFGLQRWLEIEGRAGKVQWRAVENAYLMLYKSAYMDVLRELLHFVRGPSSKKSAFEVLSQCVYLMTRRCGMHSSHKFRLQMADAAEALDESCPDGDGSQRLGGNADVANERLWGFIVTFIWAADSIDLTSHGDLCDNMTVSCGIYDRYHHLTIVHSAKGTARQAVRLGPAPVVALKYIALQRAKNRIGMRSIARSAQRLALMS